MERNDTGGAGTAVAPVVKPKYPLVLGKPIEHRTAQQLGWTVASVLLGTGVVAGAYWLLVQQHYPFMPGSGTLKLWWDNGMGFIHGKAWPAYRHGIRDNGEPAVWTMAGATVLGKFRASERRLPRWLYVIAPLALLILLVAGAAGITWLTDFGPLSRVNDTVSWQQLVLGVALGRVLHLAWSPIGATIRHRIVAGSALGDGGVPLWVRQPLAPPAWREMWCDLRVRLAGEREESGEDAVAGIPARIAVMAAVVLFLFVAVVGLLAKWGIPHGLRVPGMTS